MKRLRVGVIGVGQMGRHHVRVYSSLPNVDLVGISDLRRNVVRSVAREYCTTAYTDHLKLLQKDLDAVSIAVPTSVHKDVAIDVAEYGVDMLIEKPIADSVRNAKEIVKTTKRAGVKVMIGHIERFNPAILKLKEIVAKGVLGEVLSMSGRRVGPYSERIRDVGVIVDLAVHEIDTMSYLYDDRAVSVYAVGGRSSRFPHDFEDYASILLRYSGNRSGMIETNWLTSKKIRTLTVVGTEGVANVDYIEKKLEICKNGNTTCVNVKKEEPLRNELEHFVSSIMNEYDPMPSSTDGLYVLLVAVSAIKSCRWERTVNLKDGLLVM